MSLNLSRISVPHLIKELSYLPLRLRYYINSSNSICISKSSARQTTDNTSLTHTHTKENLTQLKACSEMFHFISLIPVNFTILS